MSGFNVPWWATVLLAPAFAVMWAKDKIKKCRGKK